MKALKRMHLEDEQYHTSNEQNSVNTALQVNHSKANVLPIVSLDGCPTAEEAALGDVWRKDSFHHKMFLSRVRGMLTALGCSLASVRLITELLKDEHLLKQWILGLNVIDSYLHQYVENNCKRDYEMACKLQNIVSTMRAEMYIEMMCERCLQLGAMILLRDIEVLVSILETNIKETLGADMNISKLLRLLHHIIYDLSDNRKKLKLNGFP